MAGPIAAWHTSIRMDNRFDPSPPFFSAHDMTLKAMEIASALAEVAAFFLVTIDLYGEERLIVLNGTLTTILRKIEGRLRQNLDADSYFKDRTFGSYLFFMSTAIAIFVGAVTLLPHIFEQTRNIETGTFWHTLWLFSSRFVWGFAWVIVVLFPIFFLLELVRGMARLGLWLLQQIEAKGVFLFLGTVLFILAKGILIAGLISTPTHS